ncbi:Cytochrome P450 monooxygenase easK [Ceratocystis fimbriata CBS 114723]|uniref:Cytochrome P450 monooxygenase easK n=1 Tax=Ceratocystis fimbriata CBS 114723 TaxID=1035309 RepID=A0A2C5WSU9_9PEZI|nr:Cytochrome P450 monooxygenase easK [Ceratocystis fimbriata CBS 114723]
MPSTSSAPGSTGNGPLNKSEFYLASALQPPVRNLFGRVVAEKDSLDLLSERDGVKYRRQRRMLGSVYSAAAMAKLRPSVKAVVEKAILRIKSVQQDSRNLKGDKEKLTADSQTRSIQSQGLEALDIREWTHIIAIEALSASVLSWSPGFLRDGTDHHTGEHGYLTWRRRSVFGLFPLATKAGQASKATGRLWGRLWGITFPTPKGFRPFFPGVYRQVKRRINLLVPTHSNPKPKGDARQDLLFSLIQLHLEKPEFTDEYLRRMAVTNFGAGHETLAATLTAALALIAMEPGVQKKVYEEMQLQQAEDSATSVDENTASANGKGGNARDKPMGYTYLQACIKESQRLFPVISMSMSRVVGPGGLCFGGYTFPPGTTIGCSPTAIHRSMQLVGPDSYSFRPERWLVPISSPTSAASSTTISPHSSASPCPDDCEPRAPTWTLASGLQVPAYCETESPADARLRIAALERNSLAWGAPGHTCPGRHLAELVVSETVAGLCRAFELQVDGSRDALEDSIRAYYLCVLFDVKVDFQPR